MSLYAAPYRWPPTHHPVGEHLYASFGSFRIFHGPSGL